MAIIYLSLMSFYVDNGDSQIDQSQYQSPSQSQSQNQIISQSQSQSHSLREVVVSDDVVISKPKRGRPRKSGRALEVDDVVESVTDVTNKKRVKVKRLVHFQSRSSQRLNCK